MMTTKKRSDATTERAALYALDALPAEEAAAVAAALESDAALRDEVESFAAVAEALADAAPPLQPPMTLRVAVLDRIGAGPTVVDQDGLRFVRGNQPWQPSGLPGIDLKVLATDPDSGRRTSVVRLAAGAEYPPHRHGDVEEIYLLEGDLIVSGVAMRPGDYCRADAGTVHDLVRSPNGCVLLVSVGRRDEYLDQR